LGDAIYVVPALLTSQAHVRAGDDAFVYRFDWTQLSRTPAWSLRGIEKSDGPGIGGNSFAATRSRRLPRAVAAGRGARERAQTTRSTSRARRS